MPRLAVVTCRVLPEPDPDQAPLLDALRAAGLAAKLVAWDAPGADLAGYDLAILRSCWNYPRDVEGFRAWLESAARATRLVNPLALLRWNLHKRYLVELAAAGVPSVPTAVVERGERVDLARLADGRGWGPVVVKPAVSAASFRTARFEARERAAAQAFLDALAAERDALVQPWLAGFAAEGERALVWIDGAWTHAVVKRPRFADEDESVSDAFEPGDAERELATRALEVAPRAAGGGALYGRADLVPDGAGGWLVSELELLEPSLFLVQHPPALERLVAALAREAGARAPASR